MELLYLWVEEYGNFYKQGFNFNSKFKFLYEEKKLECSLNKKHIKNFFYNLDNHKPVVQNITAIVGNNGAGKTTVLDLIMNMNKLDNTDFIIIGVNKNKEIIINTSFINLEVFTLDGYTVKLSNELDLVKNFNCIYHSNTLDHRKPYEDKCSNIKDISTTNLIMTCEDNRRYTNQDERILVKDVGFFYNDFNLQLDFISHFDTRDNFIDFNLPKWLCVTTKIENNKRDILRRYASETYENKKLKDLDFEIPLKIVEEDYDKISISNFIINKLSKIFNEIKRNKFNLVNKEKQSLRFSITEGILFNFILGIYKDIEENEKNLKLLFYILEYMDSEFKIIYSMEIEFIIDVLNLITQYNDKKIYEDKIRLLDQLICMKSTSYMGSLDKGRRCIEYKINTNNIDDIKNIYYIYVNSIEVVEYLSFSWKMSSGEYNMLSLFSRLYGLINKEVGKVIFNNHYEDNCITVLIDEADMSFHPEWQRKYVDKLLIFFVKVYSKHNVNIIFTTHSPILLSDIPNENIIYLKREENETSVISSNNKTFGANIYNLYNDNFFFNSHNSFGIIGEFATNKIVNIIKNIDLYCKKFNEESDLDYGAKLLKQCKDIIDITGEEYINIILNQKYRNLEKLLKFKSGDTVDIEDYKNYFNSMSPEEKKEFIKYIVENYKG